MVGNMGQLPCFKDLIAVLFECFLIISLGYLSCRFKLITHQAKDLNSYLTTFALPMIIFLNIAQMEFETINLSFLLCMLTAKMLVFTIVTLVTLTISYPRNFGYAGSLSILATQSNDFALGYPLIKSLYGENKPEMLNYLSLMAPIQLLILNPLGIALLEYEKARKKKATSPVLAVDVGGTDASSPRPPSDFCSHSRTLAHNEHQDARQATNAQIHTFKTGQATSMSSIRAAIINRGSPVPPKTVIPDSNDVGVSISRPLVDCHLASASMISPKKLGVLDKSSDKRSLSSSRVSTGGFKHRNIKSLILALPSRNEVIESDEESLPDSSSTTTAHTEVKRFHQRIQSRSPTPLLPQNQQQYTAQITRNNAAQTLLDRLSPSSHRRIYNEVSLTAGSPINNSSFTQTDNCCSCRSDPQCQPTSKKGCCRVNLGFLKALATNPLIIASVVALLVNLLNGPELPKFVTRVSNTIAASFAAPALFVVGISMYGKFELFRKNPNDLLLSSILALTKVVILPNLMRTLALIILPKYTPADEIVYLIDFSFLYGLLPTAPTACIIAKQYGVLSNVVSLSMLLSTFASAPLMLGSAVIINPTNSIDVNVVEKLISQTVKVSGTITLTLVPLTLYGFWKSKKNLNYTNFINIAEQTSSKFKTTRMQIFLILLVLSQIMIGFGGFIWYFVEDMKTSATNNTIQHQSSQATSLPSFVNNSERATPNNSLMTKSEDMHMVAFDPSTISPVPEMVDSLWLAESFKFDLGTKTVLKLQYVLSSSGLMLARFVVLCMIATLAAARFKSSSRVRRASSYILKSYAIIGSIIVIWLIVDSRHLKHMAVEPSLPNSYASLIVRLVYNMVFLSISIPLFALIIRRDNKSKKKSEEMKSMIEEIAEPLDPEARNSFYRHLVTSSASLSSDTSSALTANTSLDLASNASQVQIDTNNNPHFHNDQLSVAIETGSTEQAYRRPISAPDVNMFGPYGAILTEVTQNTTTNAGSNIEQDNSEADDIEPKVNDSTSAQPRRASSKFHEFNKYSILIVFMLIDSLLNLTSIAQKLIQNQPFGTYRQIELMDAAMEFGQGLLTFIVYGMRGSIV